MLDLSRRREVIAVEISDGQATIDKIDRLRALRARVEMLKEPDRYLDGEIMFEMFAVPVGHTGFLWPEDNPSWSFALRLASPLPSETIARNEKSARLHHETPKENIQFRHGDDWIIMNNMRVPKLTASVDAAEIVKPSGAYYSVGHLLGGYEEPVFSMAHIYNPQRSGGNSYGNGFNHACALTSAALFDKISSMLAK